MSKKSSSHKMYWEQSENTLCREFHRNWKISGKIRTKENRNSRDLGDHQIQLCYFAIEKYRPGRKREEFHIWIAVGLGRKPMSTDCKNNF